MSLSNCIGGVIDSQPFLLDVRHPGSLRAVD